MKKFLSIIIFCQIFLINYVAADQFIMQKKCPLYLNENPIKKEKFLNEEEIGKKFTIQGYKKIKHSDYVVVEHINDNNIKNNLLINIKCGYSDIQNKTHQFNPLIDTKEIKNIEKNITEFDQKILTLCGPFGSQVNSNTFKEFLKNQPNELDHLYNFSNKNLFLKQSSKNQFIDELTNLLFNQNGFTHIFCGILKLDKIAGPHYGPRFIELQKKQIIGNIDDQKDKCGKILSNEIIFNKSMKFINPANEIKIKCQNSFAINFNGIKILENIIQINKIKTKPEDQSNKKIFNKTSCLLKAQDLNNQEIIFRIVFDKKEKSIITFYPVLSDKCIESNKNNPEKCFCPLN